MAWDQAVRAVEARLKHPAGAEWPDIDGFFPEYDVHRLVTRVGGSWIVMGWVDAPNAFNAPVRYMWSVEIPDGGVPDVAIDNSPETLQAIALLQELARLH